MASPSFLTEVGRWPRWLRWVVLLWFAATIALGTAGYVQYENQGAHSVSVLTALYHTAQLFALHAPHFDKPVNWMLEFARWSAALFFAGAVYQVGLLLSQGRVVAWRVRRLSGHLIVCGLGRRGLQCARYERAKDKKGRRRVVVIDRAPAPDLAAECAAIGADVLTGDVGDQAVLRRAGVVRASELYALCPEDSTNCETAMQAARALNRRPDGTPLQCSVHLSDVDLRVELQRYAGVAAKEARIALRFFDLFDLEARRVLLHELPIDHGGIGVDDPRRVHLVILGFGRMGRTMTVRAAKLGHFANFTRDPALRLQISVIDRLAQTREAALLFRYPQFRQTCDLKVHSLDIESIDARDLLERWCGDDNSVTSLAVCFDDETRAAEVALKFLPLLQAHSVPVAVRLARRSGLATLLERIVGGSPPCVHPVGMLEERCCEDAVEETTPEQLARAIHRDFVAKRIAEGRSPGLDPALADWRELDEDLRESNRQQADHMYIKLRAIQCELSGTTDPRPPVQRLSSSEVEMLAQVEHARWSAERLLAGWTYDAAPKSLERRTSPHLVHWSRLSEDVKEYDRDAVRAIPGLIAGIGMKVCRKAPPS